MQQRIQRRRDLDYFTKEGSVNSFDFSKDLNLNNVKKSIVGQPGIGSAELVAVALLTSLLAINFPVTEIQCSNTKIAFSAQPGSNTASVIIMLRF